MPMGESCVGSGKTRNSRQLAFPWVIMAAVLLGLAACNPVDTWRDLTGTSRNDPDPETTSNTKNLAAGEASDYPNLATVPAPPVRALTAAEREKLTQSLIADRENARHSDEQLRVGFSSVAAAAPAPGSPAESSPGSTPGSRPGSPPGSPPGSASTSLSQPAPVAPAPVPASPAPVTRAANLAGPGKPAQSLAAVQPPDTAPSGGPSVTSEVASANATPPGMASPAAPLGRKAPAQPGQGLRPQGQPPEPGPMESSLQVPQPRAAPEPEQVEPAPPPPQWPPAPRVATAPTPLPGGFAAGGALAPIPLPQAKTAAGYEPAPAPPELPPEPPARTAAAGPGKSNAKPPAPTATPVAEIKFSPDSTTLTETDRQTLQTVVPAYQQNPGKVRIVGYASAAGGATEQLDSYRTALDRAQAVAAALTNAGIPSDKIQVEAAPQGQNSGESRAEVLLEH
jgi:outer membrane protein OmpA-like peptidoglycan-associated protein